RQPLRGHRSGGEDQPFNRKDETEGDDEIRHDASTASPPTSALARAWLTAHGGARLRTGPTIEPGPPGRIGKKAEEVRIRSQQHAGIAAQPGLISLHRPVE